jgi:hypothetical protein
MLLGPVQQVTVPVAYRAAGDLDEPGTAAADPPILESTNGVPNEGGSLMLGDQAV